MNTSDDIKKLLGKRIKSLRKHSGLTQEALAEKVGIEPNNLSRIENGKNYPTPENLNKISVALNVEINELFIFNHLKPINELKKVLCRAIEDDEKLARLIYGFYQTIK